MRTFLALALSLVCATSALAATKLPPAHEFFTDGQVRTFKITVEQPGLGVLEKNDRSYVKATITEGTNVFKDVGIHLKGMGSFRPFNEKPSFAVKFDKYLPKQDYFGLSKLMLNNSSQDGTYLAEMIATQMFRDGGLPAARVTHAFVEVNGRALGVYVAIEAMNADFLKQYFRNTKGNLYEAYLQDIDARLDQDGGTDTTQTDLTNLVTVTKIKKSLERWDALQKVLEVDKYISHLALELFTSHTDGYARNRNNYRLYHDPTTGKFNFLVHGLDWAYADTGVPIEPPLGSRVTQAVIQTPQGRQLYRERARELYTNVFHLEMLTNRVNTAIANLQRAARNTNEAREFRNWGNEMNNRLVARHKNIAEQLAQPEPKPLAIETNATVHITGWKPKDPNENAKHDETRLDGHTTFHIRAIKGDVIASWRTSLLLDEGFYRLQALACVTNVVTLTNDLKRANGAGLRISQETRTQQLLGSTGWTPLSYDFEVASGGEVKELICELRARKGEVWFDSASLKLTRLAIPPEQASPKLP